MAAVLKIAYRGFESHPLRQNRKRHLSRFLFSKHITCSLKKNKGLKPKIKARKDKLLKYKGYFKLEMESCLSWFKVLVSKTGVGE